MMIRFLAIWLADRCGLFEETELAASTYLQARQSLQEAENVWRSRLEEAQNDVIFYRGITARDLEFQRTIAARLGCIDDSLTLTDQMSKTIETITKIADGMASIRSGERDFVDKLTTILIGSDAVCDATPIDVQRSALIDAAEKRVIVNQSQTQKTRSLELQIEAIRAVLLRGVSELHIAHGGGGGASAFKANQFVLRSSVSPT